MWMDRLQYMQEESELFWSPLEGDKLKYKVCLQYQTTNNEVEYEASLNG